MLAPPGRVALAPPSVRDGVDELLLDGVLTAELLVLVDDLLVSEDDELAEEPLVVVVDDLLVAVEEDVDELVVAGELVVVLDLLVAVLELELELLLEEDDEAGLETLDPPDVLVLPDVVLTSPDVLVSLEVLELVELAAELVVPLVLLVLLMSEEDDELRVAVVFCVAVRLSVVLEELLRVCAFAEFVASISTMPIASAVVRYFFIVPWICCNSLFKMRTKVIRNRG